MAFWPTIRTLFRSVWYQIAQPIAYLFNSVNEQLAKEGPNVSHKLADGLMINLSFQANYSLGILCLPFQWISKKIKKKRGDKKQFRVSMAILICTQKILI